MSKYFFKRILPSPDKIARNRFLRPILKYVDNSRIWQVNRHTVSGGIAIGVFFAFIPIPFQMAAAALCAILTRMNVAAAVLFTWVSNPATWGPIFYFNYLVGVKLLGSRLSKVADNDFMIDKLTKMTGEILIPLFSGSLFVGMIAAALAYVFISFWWLRDIMRFHNKRMDKYISYRNRHRHDKQNRVTYFFRHIFKAKPVNEPEERAPNHPNLKEKNNDHT